MSPFHTTPYAEHALLGLEVSIVRTSPYHMDAFTFQTAARHVLEFSLDLGRYQYDYQHEQDVLARQTQRAKRDELQAELRRNEMELRRERAEKERILYLQHMSNQQVEHLEAFVRGDTSTGTESSCDDLEMSNGLSPPNGISTTIAQSNSIKEELLVPVDGDVRISPVVVKKKGKIKKSLIHRMDERRNSDISPFEESATNPFESIANEALSDMEALSDVFTMKMDKTDGNDTGSQNACELKAQSETHCPRPRTFVSSPLSSEIDEISECKSFDSECGIDVVGSRSDSDMNNEVCTESLTLESKSSDIRSMVDAMLDAPTSSTVTHNRDMLETSLPYSKRSDSRSSLIDESPADVWLTADAAVAVNGDNPSESIPDALWTPNQTNFDNDAMLSASGDSRTVPDSLATSDFFKHHTGMNLTESKYAIESTPSFSDVDGVRRCRTPPPRPSSATKPVEHVPSVTIANVNLTSPKWVDYAAELRTKALHMFKNDQAKALSYLQLRDRLVTTGYDQIDVDDSLALFGCHKAAEMEAIAFLCALRKLTDMGFSKDTVRDALILNNSDVDRAMEDILQHAT